MKPINCNTEQYPCIFMHCCERVCYTCNPDESIQYICTLHTKRILEYLTRTKNKSICEVGSKIYNYEAWRKFQRFFPIYRWNVFLLLYRNIFKKHSSKFAPNISKRYWHYFDAFVSVPEQLIESYKSSKLEEDYLYDDDDSPEDLVARYWSPLYFGTTKYHKDRDY